MKGQSNKKKRFDRFKVSAVKMVTQEGQKAAEVARIYPNMLVA